MSDETTPRAGSSADLSRRMDRIEEAHASLATTVARVELNQQHAEELNKLRFSALDAAVGNVAGKLDSFMARVEGIITGEVETNQTRQGRALVEDYTQWRETVEARLDSADTLATQVRLLGRMAVLLPVGSIISAAVAAAVALSK